MFFAKYQHKKHQSVGQEFVVKDMMKAFNKSVVYLQAEHCKGSAGPHVDWFAARCAVVAALADIGVVRLL